MSATTPLSEPSQIPVEDFVKGIDDISKGIITKQGLYEYLTTYQIDRQHLERYKHWSPEKHTRNLIFRNDRIEVMLICWNIGNRTPPHTHNGQLGWMSMIEGKLFVENFHLNSCNKPENQQVIGMDCLAGATKFDMTRIGTELAAPGGPLNTVDKTQTIHRIANLPEWDEKAVSLHIYSLPIDSCVVFDLDEQRCFRKDLKYDY